MPVPKNQEEAPRIQDFLPQKIPLQSITPIPDDYHDDYELDRGIQSQSREMLGFAFAKLVTSMLTLPFENAKILQQCQYIPVNTHDDVGVGIDAAIDTEESTEDEENEVDDLSDEEEEEEEEMPRHNAQQQQQQEEEDIYTSHDTSQDTFHTPLSGSLTDASGYIIQSSYSPTDPTRPTYKHPPLVSSLRSTVSSIYAREGFWGLFKGFTYSLCYDATEVTLQPTIESALNEHFGLEDSLPLTHLDNVTPNLLSLLSSSVVTSYILTPLELIRLRTVLTPLKHNAPPLPSLYSVYTHPLLTPLTLIHSFLHSLFTNATHVFLTRVLKFSPLKNPIKYLLAELVIGTIELGVLLPIETVKRRVSVDVLYHSPRQEPTTKEFRHTQRYDTVVDISPIPSPTISSLLTQILYRETSRPPRQRQILSRRRNKKRRMNVKALYRGWGLQFWGMVGVTLLRAIGGLDEGDE